MKKILFAVFAVFLGISVSFAGYNKSIIYSFLDIAPDARSASLGDAVSSLKGGNPGAFANPAVITGAKSAEASVTMGKWFGDTSYQSIFSASPVEGGFASLQLMYVKWGEFEVRDDYGGLMNEVINSFEIAVGISYAVTVFDSLSAGFTVKTVGNATGEIMKGTGAADIGLVYEISNMKFGVSAGNIGFAEGYGFPMAIRGGASGEIKITQQHSVLVTGDLKHVFGDETVFATGAEYSFESFLFARLGYRMRTWGSPYDMVSGLTFGTGIRVAGIIFDYALVPYGALGLTHRVTAGYVFK